MDWGEMLAQYGFPIALAAYLVWDKTQGQAKRDSELVSAIKEQKTATEGLIKTVNCLSFLIAKQSGQDIEQARRLAGLSE